MATIQERFREAMRAWRNPSAKAESLIDPKTIIPSTTAIPDDWWTVPFAPGRPLEPWTQVPSYREDRDKLEPRTMDYVPSVNATISPRIAYGLMSFARLRYLAEKIPESAMLIRLMTEEIKTLQPIIKNAKGEPVDDPDLHWMTEYPDGKTAFPLWLSRFMYNILVYDAPALYRIRTDDMKQTIGLRVVDGSTIFVIIDQRGEQPAPPSPAFTQIIQGTPFVWMTSQQLWYRPRQARADAPYGRTPAEDVERVMDYLDNLWNYEAAKYTEGNMPEMFLTAPEGWTPKQVLDYETTYNNRMSGNAAEKRRIRFLPPGFNKVETKMVPFDLNSYMTAFERVSYSYGFPLSEIGKAPGAGLGGKGFQDKGESQHYRQGVGPIVEFIESPFNDVLRENGYGDYHFELVFDNAETDAERRSNQVLEDWINGIANLNEARQSRGYQPVDGPLGDSRLTPQGKGLQTPEGFEQSQEQAKQLAENLGQPKEPEGEVVDQKPVDAPGGAVPEEGEVQKFDSTSTSSSAMDDHSNDAMVALFLPADAAIQLFQAVGDFPAGGLRIDPSDYHITLAYLGDTRQIPFTFEEIAEQTINFAQNWHAPLVGKINGIGTFIDTHLPGMQCLYVNFDSPDLGTFQHHLVEDLYREQCGFAIPKGHGFTPHITLGYLPITTSVDVDLSVIETAIQDVVIAWGENRLSIPIINGDFQNLEKAIGLKFPDMDFIKHCGLCEADDAYYGAPVTKTITIPFGVQGANETDVVAITPKGLPPRPGLWKPLSGENATLQDWVGGPMYPREEVAYIVDRTMEFYLVPVAYTTEVDDEPGAVVHFVTGNRPPLEAEDYAPAWIEKAAVLDFINGQIDRKAPRNWRTHPDDMTRPALIDNGLCAPVQSIADGGPRLRSAFIDAFAGNPISEEVMGAIKYLVGKKAAWADITSLVGEDAAKNMMDRANTLLSMGIMPIMEPPDDSTSSSSN